MEASPLDIAALRWRTARIVPPRNPTPALEPGRMQELYADAEDAPAAFGLAAMLAASAAGPLLWLREARAEARAGTPCGLGLAGLGVAPARLLCAVASDADVLLKAAVDALRCAGLSAVVVESWGAWPKLDLTASRRLVLAAEKSGVPLLLLRIGAPEAPSAAHSRWRVAAAPSRALACNAPGHPALDITLLRRRGAPAGQQFMVEWNADARAFAAISGAMVSAAADRQAAPEPVAEPVLDPIYA